MTSKINQLFFSMTMLLSLISVTAHALETTGDILTKEQMHITSTDKSPFDSNCTLLSLGNIANRSYTDSPDLRGWIGDVQYRSIAGIPNGKQSYGGFPFQVTNTKRPGAKDFLYLASPKWIQNSTEATLPVKTDCVAKQLVLLHAAAWTNSGKTLGVIECRFADGHKQIFEITVGQDVSDWYNGREGENARYAYAEGDSKNCGNYLSVFNLDFDHLEQISFRLTAPDGMWMISAATLLKTPRQLPKKEKIHHNLVPGIPPKIESKKEHQGSSYRLIVLGDTHFDADPKVYHHYIESDISQNAILQKEFIRNATMWQERCPRLVTAAASHITQDTPFIIQLGDLIQGDCGNAKIHKQMWVFTRISG